MNTEPRKDKIINYFALPVAIAIVASILWEYALSPLLEQLFGRMLIFMEPVAAGYINSIYHSVSDGFHESPSLYLYVIVFIILYEGLFLVALYSFISSRQKLSTINKIYPIAETNDTSQDIDSSATIDDNLRKIQYELEYMKGTLPDIDNLKKHLTKKHRTNKLTLISAILGAFICLHLCISTTFVNNLQTKTLSNIEIVSPYITDLEYKQLKSDFYSIETKKDYDTLVHSISNIAVDNHLKLKE